MDHPVNPRHRLPVEVPGEQDGTDLDSLVEDFRHRPLDQAGPLDTRVGQHIESFCEFP